jgi:hypothetical protein
VAVGPIAGPGAHLAFANRRAGLEEHSCGWPVYFGLDGTSRTEPLVQDPIARRPLPRMGQGGGYWSRSRLSRSAIWSNESCAVTRQM